MMRQDMANMRAAIHELTYQVFRGLRLFGLYRMVGVTRWKPWVEWRRERDSL